MTEVVTGVRHLPGKAFREEEDASCACLASGIPAEMMAEFLESIDVRGITKAAYAKSVRYYAAFLESTGRDGSRAADLIAFKEELLGSGRTAGTASQYLTGVRAFYAWLESEHGAPNPAKGVKGARRASGFAKDALTASQAAAVLKAMPRGTVGELRDYAMINLMIRTGLRTVEVARADVGDVRTLNGRPVLYVQGKGHDCKDDYVLLEPRALEPILEYLDARGDVGDDSPLFASEARRNPGERLGTQVISRAAKDAMRAVGLDSDRLTAHSLRHTAVTLALEGGASIQEVQAMARHASAQETAYYAHVSNRPRGTAEHALESMLETERRRRSSQKSLEDWER